MPAIQPAKLKKDVADLADCFPDGDVFLRALVNLLERYSDRTYRPGQTGDPAPLIPAYNVPAPVLRQIRQTLTPIAGNDQESSLPIIDRLWEKPILETKIIAIQVLGMLPATPPAPILSRVQAWVGSKQEEQIIDKIFEVGLARVRKDHLDQFMKLVKNWLEDAEIAHQRLGIRALHALVLDPKFQNLPWIFRQLSPLVINSSLETQNDLLRTMRGLARRSPHEAAHFLRQNLIVSENPVVGWLVRQALPSFPEEIRQNLHALARK